MTGSVLVEVTCSLCRKIQKKHTIMNINIVGSGNSELRFYSAGIEPLRFSLFTCSGCGYTDRFITNGNPLNKKEKESSLRYLNSLSADTLKTIAFYDPLMPREEKLLLSRYKLFINLLKIRRAEALPIAKACLEGAWLSDDLNDDYLGLVLRKQALRYFRAALRNRELFDENEKNRIIYLVGELNRRLGNFKNALQWFEKVRTGEKWLEDVSRKQAMLARNRDRLLKNFENIR